MNTLALLLLFVCYSYQEILISNGTSLRATYQTFSSFIFEDVIGEVHIPDKITICDVLESLESNSSHQDVLRVTQIH